MKLFGWNLSLLLSYHPILSLKHPSLSAKSDIASSNLSYRDTAYKVCTLVALLSITSVNLPSLEILENSIGKYTPSLFQPKSISYFNSFGCHINDPQPNIAIFILH